MNVWCFTTLGSRLLCKLHLSVKLFFLFVFQWNSWMLLCLEALEDHWSQFQPPVRIVLPGLPHCDADQPVFKRYWKEKGISLLVKSVKWLNALDKVWKPWTFHQNLSIFIVLWRGLRLIQNTHEPMQIKALRVGFLPDTYIKSWIELPHITLSTTNIWQWFQIVSVRATDLFLSFHLFALTLVLLGIRELMQTSDAGCATSHTWSIMYRLKEQCWELHKQYQTWTRKISPFIFVVQGCSLDSCSNRCKIITFSGLWLGF